jgi:nucleotidyltransferase/DNA polymerase involved in DNA repair
MHALDNYHRREFCDVKPSLSCKTGLAVRAIGTLKSRMAETIARFSPTESASGSETTFPEDLTDPVQIEAGVMAMADDVWAWCEKTNCRGRTITVKIKWANFQVSSRSRSMETAIETRDRLHELASN